MLSWTEALCYDKNNVVYHCMEKEKTHMKSLSIYTITRKQNTEQLQKLERQLSGRAYFLKVRDWEMNSMRSFVDQLELHMEEVYALRFFYSFTIPRLGKEFDLIQIKEEQIVNIELKSGEVTEEAIRKQLLQNRYYLAPLGRTIRSYTYISSQDRLVRLTNHDRIVEADWEQMCRDLLNESQDYEGDIEDLFAAELYLISPLTEAARFLNKEYFLTSQQRDIERQILKKIRADHKGYCWFTGLPGTGKTLLLYDIAMKLSGRQRVAIIHCGEAGQEWKTLHERLRRIDYVTDNEITEEKLSSYSAILIDEAHLLLPEKLEYLQKAGTRCPVIFSSDCEDMISPEELDQNVAEDLVHLPDIQVFHLTNRIRTNAEVSSFILNMMHLPGRRGLRPYPHVEVVYANDDREAENFRKDYLRQGYRPPQENEECLVVVMDDRYYYDEKGYLRSEQRDVRKLFHQLSRAKEELALVVKGNETVYTVLLNLLQGRK